MRFSRKNFLAFALCAFSLAIYGCSSAEKASEPVGDEAGAASSADSVGSIPEDLLAAEEKGQTSETPQNADPFSDLKENEKTADTTESAEATSPADETEKLSEGSAAGAGQMETYSVKAGDTLMKIAFTIYGDIDRWKDLQQWNPKIKKASALSRGMKIQYEAPLSPFEPDQHAHSYLIKKGDTLANIADEVYGRKMKYKKLQNYNAKLIRNPNKIFAGFTIFYDITAKEIAEAEARRQERMAGGNSGAAHSESIPSAIAPPAVSAAPAPMAVAPAPAPTGEAPAPASTGSDAPPPPPPAAN